MPPLGGQRLAVAVRRGVAPRPCSELGCNERAEVICDIPTSVSTKCDRRLCHLHNRRIHGLDHCPEHAKVSQ